ncbi:kinase-like domain-containing protein [Xylaria cf. heliscus]|nr:kinase-like domain-containing protein [Xylaria cf. heliscus]
MIRDHFNRNSSFEYEKVIGRGVFGVAYSIIERGFARRDQRLVVKRAPVELAYGELRNEIQTMSRLNGSAHIARVVAAGDDGWNTRPTGILRRLAAGVFGRPEDMLTGLKGPSLVLEHLENGTMESLMDTLRKKGKSLPNRVLWSIYLCLVRACVAMKFPPEQPFNTESKLEEIPEDQSAPGNIVHNDILIGSIGDFPEHAIIPPVKMIDFGLSVVNNRNSEQQNLSDITKLIYYLIIGKNIYVGPEQTVYNGISTGAIEILPVNGQVTYPMLDAELRDLVARSLAKDPAHRPGLAEVLKICKNAVETRTPGQYGINGPQETDTAISLFLQEVLYDAK